MASAFFDRLAKMLHLPTRTDGSRLVTLHVMELDLFEAALYRDPYLLPPH